MYTAHSDNIGCTQIMPEENAIVLKNGRRIGYNHLVVAMGIYYVNILRIIIELLINKRI